MRVRSGLLTCTQNNELGPSLTDHHLFLIYEEKTARLIGCVSLALHSEKDEGTSETPQPNCTDLKLSSGRESEKICEISFPLFFWDFPAPMFQH